MCSNSLKTKSKMSGLYIKYLFVLQDYVKYLDERNGHIMIHNHKSKIANEQTSSIIYWEQKKISFWKKKKMMLEKQ